jgi:hypothetical protein
MRDRTSERMRREVFFGVSRIDGRREITAIIRGCNLGCMISE